MKVRWNATFGKGENKNKNFKHTKMFADPIPGSAYVAMAGLGELSRVENRSERAVGKVAPARWSSASNSTARGCAMSAFEWVRLKMTKNRNQTACVGRSTHFFEFCNDSSLTRGRSSRGDNEMLGWAFEYTARCGQQEGPCNAFTQDHVLGSLQSRTTLNVSTFSGVTRSCAHRDQAAWKPADKQILLS